METKEKEVKDMDVQSPNDVSVDVKTNTRNFVIGDPVLYRENNKTTVGKIGNVFQENGVSKIELEAQGVNPSKIVKANDPNLDPLFFQTKEDKKVYLKFSYNEIKELLKTNEEGKNRMLGLTWEDLHKAGKAYNNLMLGNRTEVIENIQVNKEIEKDGKTIEETFTNSARLELRRNSNGIAKVHAEFKNRELNLDSPVYGKKLNQEQKDQLMKTGELGLVKGFANQKTGEVFNLWLGLDTKLNKVVRRTENEIYIDKIFGVKTTEQQKEELRSGKGTVVEFTKKDGTPSKVFVMASAVTTKGEGLKSFDFEKAKELGLVGEKKNQVKTQKNDKGIKL